MTRGARDYSQGKIYEIVCNKTGEVYVGSTCKKYLSQRLAAHLKSYNDWKKGRYGFMSSFPIIGRGDYEIFLLEECPCNNVLELKRKEREWIDKKKCVNLHKPFNVPEEDYQKQYYKLNQEHKLEYLKQWRDNNREKTRQDAREYYEKNKETYKKKRQETIQCECGLEVNKQHISRHKKTKKHERGINK